MKNLFKIALTALMLLSVKTYAQESIIPEIKYSDLEKYIDLALKNYPRTKVFDVTVEKAHADVVNSSLAYLDIFNASYIYRPNDQAAINPVNPYSVNGFQLGVNFNLGTFLQKPFLAKKAKADYKIAQLQQQDFKLTLGTEVKKRYYDYLQQISLLKLTTEMAQENKGVAESLRNKFEKGEISLDAYNQSRINQFNSMQGKIQAEAQYFKSKDLLEEIIGAKLTDVK
ncbi:TolC family protein [Pedobacter fastidiosus]|uniref:TolC family protein n=1 Tax=Pedobacter fastidiosus TaxID=2765361 RepID=A0ABR7KVJ7_9SPHI|nr:TolC family protein [Pedobacter fastidiosus]MBC6112129.1 TolC family protein [Pedobacter fastidiosus]